MWQRVARCHDRGMRHACKRHHQPSACGNTPDQSRRQASLQNCTSCGWCRTRVAACLLSKRHSTVRTDQSTRSSRNLVAIGRCKLTGNVEISSPRPSAPPSFASRRPEPEIHVRGWRGALRVQFWGYPSRAARMPGSRRTHAHHTLRSVTGQGPPLTTTNDISSMSGTHERSGFLPHLLFLFAALT
jgi:hypothetical protein